MDAVQAANSGHPGTPMALAPVTYKLCGEQIEARLVPFIWKAILDTRVLIAEDLGAARTPGARAGGVLNQKERWPPSSCP